MKERFRELAEQAGLEYNFDPMLWLKYEKFAELIVRECIDTLLWHGCDDAVPYIEWMATNKLGQHFGVEE